MKTEIKTRWRIITAIITAAALIAAAVGISYAEYVKSSRVKQVIASYGDDGGLFSSNYLVANNNPSVNVYRRFFYIAEDGIAAGGNITICNFAQGNPTRTYESDIEYTLTARFVTLGESNGAYVKSDANAAAVGSHSVTLSFNDGSSVTLDSSHLSYTFSPNSTLDHRVSVTDVLSVEFDANFRSATSLGLYVAAIPTVFQSGVHTLDAVFGVALSSGEARNVWTGEFNETTTSGVPAQPGYDGFNYLITGNGSGTCTLAWNNTKLQISQVFLSQNSLTPTVSGTTTSVTFAVDSDVINRYDLQFYYAEGAAPFASWAELTGGGGGNGYVTLTYVES